MEEHVKAAGHQASSQEEMVMASLNLAPWLSAALDDPLVCEEYKTAIKAWFNTAMPSAAVDRTHAIIMEANSSLEQVVEDKYKALQIKATAALQDLVDNLHQRLDNIIAAGAIPMPNQLRLLALDESLHSIRAELAEHISYDPA